MEKLVSPGQREPKRGVLSDDLRGDSSWWIAAFQVHAHAAVTQAYGWPIRSAVGFHRWLHASYFPESVMNQKARNGCRFRVSGFRFCQSPDQLPVGSNRRVFHFEGANKRR